MDLVEGRAFYYNCFGLEWAFMRESVVLGHVPQRLI